MGHRQRLIRFIYYIYNYRLLYYLPMERMEKRTDFYDFIEKVQRQDKYIEELEEENKKLKEENEELKKELEKAHTAYRAVRKVNRAIMNGYV